MTLILLIALSLLYLISARISFRYNQYRIDCVRREWNPVFNAIRAGKSADIPALANTNRMRFLELWTEQRTHANKAYAVRLVELGIKLDLDSTICKVLGRNAFQLLPPKVWLQSIAIAAIQWLPSERALRLVERKLESHNRYLVICACSCLVRLKAPGFERAVIKTLFRYPEEAPTIVSQIGKAGGANILLVLGPFLDKLPRKAFMNFISLAETSNDKTLLPVIQARMASARNPEEIAILLRAIGHLGGSEQRPLVRAYLNHENESLRIQATNALCSMGDQEDIPILTPLLSHPEWWIRYRAASAIASLYQNDRQQLKEFASTLSDPLALDMLTHVTKEQEWCLV